MADHHGTPKDVGKDSPASKSAKEQRMSGSAGGSQAAQESGSTEKQPPQTSGRRDPAHEHEGTVRKGYEAAQNPERQGDGDPGPEQIRESSSLQGHGGAGGGSRGGQAEDRSASAQAGEPQGEHTGTGRQKSPGDRDPQQPS